MGKLRGAAKHHLVAYTVLCCHRGMKRIMLNLLLCASVLALTAVTFTGCVTNPETGRSQLMIVSENEMTQLGISSFDQMKKEVPISKDANANAMVRRVGERIKSVVNLPNAQWEFVVFDSKEANAFCLPGGKIGVYSGILPITKDDAGLAAVMGHEVAHATLQHGRERMSQGLAAGLLGQVGGAVVDAKNPQWTSAFGQLYGMGAQVGVLLPNSRGQEAEADKQGLIYMVRAGYDPEAAVQFWERFAEYGAKAGGAPPKFLSTHPPSAERIENLKKWIPEVKAAAQPRR
jgi:predicted Zn-dependent protease